MREFNKSKIEEEGFGQSSGGNAADDDFENMMPLAKWDKIGSNRCAYILVYEKK